MEPSSSPSDQVEGLSDPHAHLRISDETKRRNLKTVLIIMVLVSMMIFISVYNLVKGGTPEAAPVQEVMGIDLADPANRP